MIDQSQAAGAEKLAAPRKWRAANLFWIAVFGLALRVFHYARNPSVWQDEAAILMNVIAKNFHALLGPLEYHQAAPPLFLWLEHLAAITLGESTFALRLLPMLASCAAPFLFIPICRAMLAPWPAAVAMVLMACSDQLLWHSCEAKPYAVDVFACVLLMFVYVKTQGWEMGRRVIVVAAFCLTLVWLSYPAAFFAAGVFAALAWQICEKPALRVVLLLVLGMALVALSIFMLAKGPIAAQSDRTLESWWTTDFAPLATPLKIPVWLIVRSAEISDYAFRPVGGVLVIYAVIGAVCMARKNPPMALLILVPYFANVAAAFAAKYPLGGSRLNIYLLPALALFIGRGVERAAHAYWKWTKGKWPQAAFVIPAAIICGAVVLCLFHVTAPWARADTKGAVAEIFAERQPGDHIMWHAWEFDYYFRHETNAADMVNAGEKVISGRVWFPAEGWTAEQRAGQLEHLRDRGWNWTVKSKLQHVDVVVLERKKPG